MAEDQRVLVAGPPRGGTTWVGEILSSAPQASYCHEPDNHSLWPLALLAKEGLGRQPALDLTEKADTYDRVWNLALGSADNKAKPGWALRKAARKGVSSEVAGDILAGRTNRATRMAKLALSAAPAPKPQPRSGPLVVKTVHAGFCLERVARLANAPVVVVVRDPRNGVASWLDLNWKGQRFEADHRVRDRILPWLGVTGAPPPGDPTVDAAWGCGLLDASLRTMGLQNSEWMVVEHEDLSENPVEGFRAIFEHAQLEWTPSVEKKIVDGDKAGTGYETTRVRSDLRYAWKTRLTDAQIDKVEEVLQVFEI